MEDFHIHPNTVVSDSKLEKGEAVNPPVFQNGKKSKRRFNAEFFILIVFLLLFTVLISLLILLITTGSDVPDTTPPVISVSVSPDTLLPNHKMEDVTATVNVIDICDPNPSVVLTSIVSNEPDDAKGNGDGKTIDDIQDADIGTEDYKFQLRAERAGRGTGRIYTITYTATDASGNSTNATATVIVPHRYG